MGNTAESIGTFPQAFCARCETKTPHRHERLAVNGAQIARRVCMVCKSEHARDGVHRNIPGKDG